MKPADVKHSFNFTFEKTSEEIKTKCQEKALSLTAKIEDRQARVAALRAEHGIDDKALIQLLTEARKHSQDRTTFSYVSNSPVQNGPAQQERTIGAGVVNFLLTESDFIESEKESIKRLQMIIRNLRPLVRNAAENGAEYPEDRHSLTYSELEFLGF